MNITSVQNLTNYLIERDVVPCLNQCLTTKMNYLSVMRSPLEKVTSVSGPLLVEKYFLKVKERYMHQIVRSFTLEDILKIMELPNIFSYKLFKRFTHEDSLVFPTARISKLKNTLSLRYLTQLCKHPVD